MKCLILSLIVLALAYGPVSAAPDPESVVREDVRALTENDMAALMALFGEDSKVFVLPTDPDRLTGELSTRIGTQDQRRLAFTPMANPQRTEIAEMVSAGDLVIAKLRLSEPPTFADPTYSLVIFRIRDGKIFRLWHVAKAAAQPAREAASRAVIERFVKANNAGDVEALVAQFSPLAKNFRNTGDPDRLGDKPSTRMVDEASRRAAFSRMAATGNLAQVEVMGMVALGDLVVSRDVATLPGGAVVDGISAYRIHDGKIVHDWYVYEQPRS